MPPKKIKTIKQTNPGDCAICAMAMFLDLSYADMIRLMPFVCENISKIRGGGMTKEEMLHIIAAISGRPPVLIQCHYDPNDYRLEEMMGFIQGRKAILSARSLNYVGCGHATFWDGKKLHDPSRKKTYTIKTIKPYEIII